MKRMIDTEKFLDKLLYMGYMDEEKSEVEEVANRMTEDAYTQDEVIVMLAELVKEINPIKECEQQIYGKDSWNFVGKCQDTIQQKINKLKGNENGDERYCYMFSPKTDNKEVENDKRRIKKAL